MRRLGDIALIAVLVTMVLMGTGCSSPTEPKVEQDSVKDWRDGWVNGCKKFPNTHPDEINKGDSITLCIG